MYRHQGVLPIGSMGCCAGAMGDDAASASQASSTGGATTWIAGGLLVGLAALMFAVDTKDPLGLKKAA